MASKSILIQLKERKQTYKHVSKIFGFNSIDLAGVVIYSVQIKWKKQLYVQVPKTKRN